MITVVIGAGMIVGVCGLAFIMAITICEAAEAYAEWKDGKRKKR